MTPRKNLFILRGPSSAGKSTVEDGLISKNMVERFKIDTTRPSRNTEGDSSAYNFLSPKEFLEKNESKEYASTIILDNGWSYGYPTNVFESSDSNLVCSIIDEDPALELKKWIEDNMLNMSVWIVDFNIPRSTRELLLKNRGDSEEDIKFRLDLANYDSSYEPDLAINNLYSALHMVQSFVDSKTEAIYFSVKDFLKRNTRYRD